MPCLSCGDKISANLFLRCVPSALFFNYVIAGESVNTVDFKNVGNFFKKNGKLVKKALTNCVSMIKITLIKMILVFEKLIFVRSDFLVEKSGKLNFRF